MKRFLSAFFASFLGVFLASCILLFLGTGIVLNLLFYSSEPTVYKPKAGTVFRLSLKGRLAEQAQDNTFAKFFGSNNEIIAVADIVKAIRNAQANPDIAGIYIDAGNLNGGFASLEAIRNELEAFRKAGKFIVSYADDYTLGTYYLSSVADSIFLNPHGSIAIKGLATQGMFFAGLGEKLGVKFEIFKAGKYKSAVEPYMAEQFSDENREQLTSCLNNIWYHLADNIAKSRNTTTNEINRYADEGMAFGEADNALRFRLADKLAYRFEAESCVKRMAGQPAGGNLQTASVRNMLAINSGESFGKDKIALVFAEGSIQSKESSSPYAESAVTEDLVKDLRGLIAKDDVKAVVLRVNSPGGDAYISEQIWKAVASIRDAKPVVVSMGDYAASGGYYISCAANKIIAEPTTLIGSIGVFGVMPNYAGTLRKIGVTTDIVKTNTYADFGDSSRPMSQDERIILQRAVSRTYDLFLMRCAEGRRMSKAKIDSVAQGRIWTGAQAVEVGLADRLGGLQTAIDEAKLLAGVDDCTVYTVNSPKDFFTESLELLFGEGNTASRFARLAMGEEELRLFNAMSEARKMQGVQARMPFIYIK